MKTCSRCGVAKPKDNFYGSSKTKDGLKHQCKKCHTEGNIRTRDPENARRLCREYMARARESAPDVFRERERQAAQRRMKNERTQARIVLNAAVKSGRVLRPNICSECKQQGKVQGHHDDYSHPLVVQWLCSLCHGKKHRLTLKQVAPNG